MLDPLPPFGAARLKLDRASRHIDALDGEVSAFLSRKPVALIVEQPEALAPIGSHAWVARIREHVPYALAPIIGDAIHNLRAALDLLATDVVRLNGKDASSVYFPFAKDAAALEGQIKAKNFRLAHPAVVDLLRSLKPYTGGNVALRALHDLDVQDKHKALIPAISAARTEAFTLIVGRHPNSIPAWETTIPRDGWWMLTLPPVWNLPLGTEIQASFSLVFRDDTPFPGAKVIPTLRSLHENCTSIVEAFATLLKGKAFPESIPGRQVESTRALIIGKSDNPVD